MKRILVFGDAHIPSRRDSIPASFYSHIEGAEYDLALVTGDLVRENEMRAAMPTLPICHIVQGNMDYGRGFDFHKQVQIDDFNILLIHGTQLRPRGNIKQLWEIVMNVGANVGIHGHTHEPAIDLREGRLLLNPGTISGATGGWAGKTDASFIELEIGGSQLTVLLHITDWQVAKQSSLQFVRQNEEIVRG
ncbi:MAG: YfcE family phosphodiesterase [Candidatus Thorarchaeota archaeon]